MSHNSPLNDDAVGQAYQQQSQEMPSSALDEKILAASRRAVAAKPTAITAKRSWRNMPFLPAIAASFFVAAVFMAQQEEPESKLTKPQAEIMPMSVSSPALMKRTAPEVSAVAAEAPLDSLALSEAILEQRQGTIEQRDQQWWLVTQDQTILIDSPPRNIAQFDQQNATVQGVITQENGVTRIAIQDIKLQ